jgi:hypothetical protein
VEIPAEYIFEAKDDFIRALEPIIFNWDAIIDVIKPIDIFIGTAMNKDGPVRLSSTAWGIDSLEDILKRNFGLNGVYICLVREETRETTRDPNEVKTELKESKQSKSGIKKEKVQPTVKKEAAENIIEDILDRKRTFSEVNREFDHERELATQRLEELEEEKAALEACVKAEGKEIGSEGNQGIVGSTAGQLEPPTRNLRSKRWRTAK